VTCKACDTQPNGLLIAGCRGCSLRDIAQGPEFFSSMRAGVTKNPGPAVLRKLGLRRVVSYERLKTPND
jgi:hypothetical protein